MEKPRQPGSARQASAQPLGPAAKSTAKLLQTPSPGSRTKPVAAVGVVGEDDGEVVGEEVGEEVGDDVGAEVGAAVTPQSSLRK